MTPVKRPPERPPHDHGVDTVQTDIEAPRDRGRTVSGVLRSTQPGATPLSRLLTLPVAARAVALDEVIDHVTRRLELTAARVVAGEAPHWHLTAQALLREVLVDVRRG